LSLAHLLNLHHEKPQNTKPREKLVVGRRNDTIYRDNSTQTSLTTPLIFSTLAPKLEEEAACILAFSLLSLRERERDPIFESISIITTRHYSISSALSFLASKEASSHCELPSSLSPFCSYSNHHYTTDKMPVSFDTSVTNENVAPEDEGDEDENKRKFHARPTPYPKKKLRSIEEDDDSDTVPPIQTGVAPSSRTILFGGIGVAGGGDSEKEEEAIEKQKVTKTNDTQ
jgi:hypothetical protein